MMKQTLTTILLVSMMSVVSGFAPSSRPTTTSSSTSTTTTSLNMGLFDFVENAFKNEAYDDRRVTASHILTETEEEAMVLMKGLKDGSMSFTQTAKEYSSCPSASDGGSLGTFEPGSMVPEFEDLVFDESTPIGEVVGPLKTKFGYHLVLVEDRFKNQIKTEGSGAF